MQYAFQGNPLASLNPQKSTDYRLLCSALDRGYRLFFYAVETLALNAEGLTASGHWLMRTSDAFGLAEGEAVTLPLSLFDQLHMRQDPPFDMRYITATCLLETLPESVKIFNPPSVVRNYSEKLLPLQFPEMIPDYLVTEDIAAVEAFAECHGDIILKPLYAFGGLDVFRIRQRDSNLIPAFDLLRRNYQCPVMAQRFIPDVKEGDKRVIVINGDIIGAFLRKPAAGQHRANLAVGGSLAAVELSPLQRRHCQTIADWLQRKGVLLAGIDMIGDYVTEINITSPMGFAQLDKLYGMKPEESYWDAALAMPGMR